jgi:hypothetical protein
MLTVRFLIYEPYNMRQSLLNLCTVIILSSGLSACDSGKDAEKSQQQAQATQSLIEQQAATLAQTQAALDQAKKATVDAQVQLEQQSKSIADEKAARELTEKLKTEHDAKEKLKADAKALAEAKNAAAIAQKEAADAKAALATKLNEDKKIYAAAKATLEAEAKAKLTADAKNKLIADAKAKLDADAKTKLNANADAKAKLDAELNAKIKADADAKIKAQQDQTDAQAIASVNQRLLAANEQLQAAWKAVLVRQSQQVGTEQITLGQIDAEQTAWREKRNTECQIQSAKPTANQAIGQINCQAMQTELRTVYLQHQIAQPNNATPATPARKRNPNVELIQQGLEIFQQMQQQK